MLKQTILTGAALLAIAASPCLAQSVAPVAPPQEQATPAAQPAKPAQPTQHRDVQREQERVQGEIEQVQREQERAQREIKRAQNEQERVRQELERASREYERAMRALDRGQYQAALRAYEEVAAAGGRRAEGALYWQAYALSRLGDRLEALAKLQELEKKYPSSRWLTDAKALELSMKAASGQAAADEKDEELKVMALRSLMLNDPERGLPMIEQMLKGGASPQAREQALFVLAQTGSPQAREILARIATGQGNPDLQAQAVRYLSLFGGRESLDTLAAVYASSNDTDVKRAVLQAFALAGDRQRLLASAKNERSPELRGEAVRQLGLAGGAAELATLYAGSSPEVKEDVLHALFLSGDHAGLVQIAKAETDPALKGAAVRNLGLIGSKGAADTLMQFYREDKDRQVRKAALDALFLQGNGAALVALARQEKDPELRQEIVSRLSLMKNKDAADYMAELLK